MNPEELSILKAQLEKPELPPALVVPPPSAPAPSVVSVTPIENVVRPSMVMPRSAPISSVPPVTPSQPPRRSGHFFLKFVIIVILICAVGATSAAAYLGIFEKSDVTVKKGILALIHASTFHYDTTTDITTQVDAEQKHATITLVGDIDRSRGGVIPNMSSDIKAQISDILFAIEIRFINQVFYSKINSTLLLNALTTYVPGIQNTWYSISGQDLESMQQKVASTTTIPQKITLPTSEEVYTILTDEGVIAGVDSLGMSRIDGAYVRGFEVTINRDKIPSALFVIGQKVMNDNKDIPVDTHVLQSAQQTVYDALKPLNIKPVKIYVDLLSGNIVKIEGGMSYDLTTINTVVTYSHIGEPVTIEVPVDATPIMKLYQASIDAAQAKAHDAGSKARLANLRIEAENYFDKHKSYAGFCTRDTLAIATLKVLRDTNGGKESSSCFDTAKQYSVASRLSDQTVYCVDATGAAKSIPGLPVSSVCK